MLLKSYLKYIALTTGMFLKDQLFCDNRWIIKLVLKKNLLQKYIDKANSSSQTTQSFYNNKQLISGSAPKWGKKEKNDSFFGISWKNGPQIGQKAPIPRFSIHNLSFVLNLTRMYIHISSAQNRQAKFTHGSPKWQTFHRLPLLEEVAWSRLPCPIISPFARMWQKMRPFFPLCAP